MAHTACVFVVAGKVAAQNPFLIEKPPEEYRQDEWNETDCEPRAKCKRYADEKPERARVHRMTDIRGKVSAASCRTRWRRVMP